MRVPSLPELLIGHWQPSWFVTLTGAFAALAYLQAAARARGGWPIGRSVAFLAGVVTVVVALESGLGSYDDRLLSVHMVQHLMLLEVAPLLLLIARPARLALRVLPAPERRSLARALARLRPWTSAPACLTVFFAVVLGTHVPGFYDATLRHPLLHDAEHVAYLSAGLLLWWPLLGDEPARRLNGLLQLGYLIVAMAPMEVVGAYLSRAPAVVYGAYAPPARGLHTSAVLDQQHAGAIMWVAGGVLMIWAGLSSAVRAMIVEERRQRVRDLHADGLALQAKSVGRGVAGGPTP